MTGEISQNDASLTGYLGSCMFGAWFLMIPAVYSAVAAVRMAAGKMEDGSFAGLVSILGNRHKICFTQDYWMGTSLLAMFVSTGILGILGGIVLAGYELEIAQYLLLNLGMFCFQLMLGGFFMMISFLLKKGRKAALAVGGFLIVEYLLYAFKRSQWTVCVRVSVRFFCISPGGNPSWRGSTVVEAAAVAGCWSAVLQSRKRGGSQNGHSFLNSYAAG